MLSKPREALTTQHKYMGSIGLI